MASKRQIDDILLLLAVKLAQPGILGDVAQAYTRLEPVDLLRDPALPKDEIRARLEHLIAQRFVWLYAGRRYMITTSGDRYVFASGLRAQIDSRRFYLLKETRKARVLSRSGARDRQLKQQS